MEPTNLTEEQRLYLQEIYHFFRKEGKWPPHKYLERRFIQIQPDLDIEEVVQSLPSGLTNPFTQNDPNSKATLTIPAMYQCRGSAQDLTPFVSLIQICVERYFDPEDDKPQISSDDLSRYLRWREPTIRKVGLLLQCEPNIWSVFTGPDDQEGWNCEIAKAIRRFRDVKTIEQYLEKRDVPRKVTSQPAIALSSKGSVEVSTEELQLHPDIRSKCWDLYTTEKYDEAIFNATKAVEVAVRTKAHLPDKSAGVDVINTAFSPKKPILRYSTMEAEQEGMMYLLRGIIQVYRNAHGHRFVGVQNKLECLGILLMCSNMLFVVDDTEFVGTI